MCDVDLSFLPLEIWPVLAIRLWHAIHIDKALSIIAEGAIRPDAPSKYVNGYCRSLGGVSLFDFRGAQKQAAHAFSCGAGHWFCGHNVHGEDEIGASGHRENVDMIHIPQRAFM